MTVLWALGASVVFGCADFIGGIASRRLPSLRVAAAGQLVAFCFAWPTALVAHSTHVTAADAGWSLASGAAAGCGLGLFYSAMTRGLISLVVPLTAVVSALLPVAYGLARGERPSTVATVGIVVALVAVAVVSSTPKTGHALSSTPVVFSIVAGALFGSFLILLSQVGEDAGMWPLVFSRSSCTLVLTSLAVGFGASPTRALRPLVRPGVAIGVFEAIGIVGLFLALQRGPVSIASVLLSLYPVTSVLLATILLEERMTRPQVAGVALALTSVALISAQ